VRSSLPELLRFGAAVAGNPHDGADLVQGALEATGLHWRRVREGGDAVAYVKRSIVNAHVSRWRRLRREWLTDRTTDALVIAPTAGPATQEPMWLALAALPPARAGGDRR